MVWNICWSAEECLKAMSVLIPVFLQQHCYVKLYVYQHNDVTKRNVFLICLRMSENIEQERVFDAYVSSAIKNILIKIYQQNNVNKCNKTYQLITYFGIFLDLLKDVWKALSKKHFFLTPTCMFLQQHSYMKLYIYQQNNVTKSNKGYQLMTCLFSITECKQI